jgi:NADH-quinone oxidoreductase subunit N
VYEGVPTIITAIFAILPKITLFSVFCNIGLSLFAFNYLIIKNLLIFSAILSILVGVFGALYQTKIKRLLAYSSISHVGFLLIGYCSFNNFGFFSLFFYLIMYMIMSLNIFVILLVLRRVNSNLKFKKINELVLLFKSNPILALNFSLVLFSIAGIPPLLGFYSKLYIFISAMMDELYLVVVIAALLSVVASLYYIRLIKLMFFKIFDY